MVAVDIMGPKQAYEKFEDELLKQLPADQPNFIALLEKEGVIDGEAKKKMNLPNRSNNKIICTAVILSVIEKSLSDSDEKFNTLLKVMEEYKNGLESLALKIRNHLDPGSYMYTQVIMNIIIYVHYTYIQVLCIYVVIFKVLLQI